MTSKHKVVRFRDSSLIDNDVLRPWTIDLNLDRRLEQESMALDKILTFTTPQKFAGTLASSVLDHPPPEYMEFRNTLDQRLSREGFPQVADSRTASNSNRGSNGNSTRCTDSSRFRADEGGLGFDGRRRPSGAPSPATEAFTDCFDAADLAYIERIKGNMYAKSMRSTRARAQTAYVPPLQSIKYSQQPFGPISPSKSKVMLLTTYQNPKLTTSLSQSKIPVIRSNLTAVRKSQHA
jgi:hypothetical protein